jgi:hypothetical protein
MKSGVPISAIVCADGRYIKSSENQQFESFNEGHGEYDTDWVICKQNGVDTVWFNPRYLQSIEWEESK